MAGLFIVILAGIAAGAITEIAKARARKGLPQEKLDELKQQLDEQAEKLARVEDLASSQVAQLEELQERVDFAERLLAQHRDRPAVGPGSVNR